MAAKPITGNPPYVPVLPVLVGWPRPLIEVAPTLMSLWTLGCAPEMRVGNSLFIQPFWNAVGVVMLDELSDPNTVVVRPLPLKVSTFAAQHRPTDTNGGGRKQRGTVWV